MVHFWFYLFVQQSTVYICKWLYMFYKLRISCSIPQGLVLGPLMFLLYISDWPNCIPGVHYLMVIKLTQAIFVALGSAFAPKSLPLLSVVSCSDVWRFCLSSHVDSQWKFASLAALVNSGKTIALCWIPSHVRIWGNERADAAAKSALSSTILAVKCPPTDLCQSLTDHCQRLWQVEWDGCLSNKLHSIRPTLGYVNYSHLGRRCCYTQEASHWPYSILSFISP